MNHLGSVINDSGGRVSITAILLGLVILFGLAAWVIVLFGHFGHYRHISTARATPAVEETATPESSEDEAGIADEREKLDEILVTPDIDDNPAPDPNSDSNPVPTDAPEEPPDDTVVPISEADPAAFAELGSIAARFNSASVSLALYDYDTGKHYTYQYGYADADRKRNPNTGTKYYVASLTKLVTAICAMTLVDGGFIGLNTDVSNYFGYELRNPHFPDTRITARMLMQHTSSIFDSGAFQVSRDNDSSESVKYLIERGSSYRRNKPGTNYEYSNFGYAVLGALCEKVSGKPLDALAREAIFEPLGIDAAYVPSNLQDRGNIAVIYASDHTVSRSVQTQLDVAASDTLGHDVHLAQGNLTISAMDYAKILAMLAGGGEYRDVRVLSTASANEMHKTNVEGPGFQQGLATRFSADAFIEGEGFYWHAGSSYGIFSQYIYSKNPNRGIVVITSGASASRLDSGMIDVCTDLSRAAWKVFGAEEDAGDPV